MPRVRYRPSKSSAWSFSSSATFFINALNSGRFPPRQALRDTRALPSVVLGPVDRPQGFQVRISTACLARRSGVQPFAIGLLQ